MQDECDREDKDKPGFIFWALSPFLLIFMIAMPFLIPEWTFNAIMVMSVLEIICLCVTLGLINSKRFSWTWRIVGALIFVAYLAYSISMLLEGNIMSFRRSSASLFNAICGLVVFGMPGLLYAILGRFSFAKQEDEEPDNDYF